MPTPRLRYSLLEYFAKWLGSKVGLDAIPKISPVWGFIRIAAALIAWVLAIASSKLFSKINCILLSKVKYTVFIFGPWTAFIPDSPIRLPRASKKMPFLVSLPLINLSKDASKPSRPLSSVPTKPNTWAAKLFFV